MVVTADVIWLVDVTQVAAPGAMAAAPAAAAGTGGGSSTPSWHRRAPARAAGPAAPILSQPSTGELTHQTLGTPAISERNSWPPVVHMQKAGGL